MSSLSIPMLIIFNSHLWLLFIPFRVAAKSSSTDSIEKAKEEMNEDVKTEIEKVKELCNNGNFKDRAVLVEVGDSLYTV